MSHITFKEVLFFFKKKSFINKKYGGAVTKLTSVK